jgi:hypothetical protein
VGSQNWSAGDTIPLCRDRMLRVIDVRPATGDDDRATVVKDVLARRGARDSLSRAKLSEADGC